ncbi:hypothetical protein C0J52_01431 [Blattella germanica]|nr:hypothetical protein C0J52_01431 [Blattella germanica]
MKLTIFLLLVFLLMGISSEPLWQEKKVANRESVHDFGLKENDPLDFPIPDLIETPDKSLDPKPNDLNAKKLKATLGSKFDANFMRISFPQSQKGQRGRELVDFSFKRNKETYVFQWGTFLLP